MTAPAFDPRQLAVAVAKAILGAIDPEADFDALPEDEQSDILIAAHAAVGAHDAWLTGAGFRILPPGITAVPKSDEEVAAYRAAIKAYEQGNGRKSGLLASATPKLIMPGLH
jgi:hypothetical protein